MAPKFISRPSLIIEDSSGFGGRVCAIMESDEITVTLDDQDREEEHVFPFEILPSIREAFELFSNDLSRSTPVKKSLSNKTTIQVKSSPSVEVDFSCGSVLRLKMSSLEKNVFSIICDGRQSDFPIEYVAPFVELLKTAETVFAPPPVPKKKTSKKK